MKPSLNIIGCGTVGRTLGFLWHRSNYFSIQGLYSRTPTSAVDAQQFIGSGFAQDIFSGLTHSNVWLISTSDDQIEATSEKLANANLIQKNDLVFHCSGALSSDVLLPLKQQGALTASAHPVKSFINEKNASENFTGTYCTLEGDKKAIAHLDSAFVHIGAQTLSINKEGKALYHASTTLICNYLCVLMDIGFDCLEKSGLDKKQASKAVKPLAIETLNNVFETNTTSALTGPIARGDTQTLKNQFNAIESFSSEHSILFKELSKQALKIASRKAAPEKLSGISDLLSNNKN